MSLSSAPVAVDGKSEERESKPIRMVPSVSVFVGGGTLATCVRAAFGAALGAAGTLGLALRMPAVFRLGGGGTRGVMTGGGTAAGLGGTALGGAGVFIAVLGTAGIAGFTTFGTVGRGGTGARLSSGGAFGMARDCLLATGGLGAGGEIFGLGAAFDRMVILGAGAVERTVEGVAACRDGFDGALRGAGLLRGKRSCDVGACAGGESNPLFKAGVTGGRPDRSIPGRVRCGPSLSKTP